MFELQGKVALITGGSGGIGLAIAKELLRNNVKGVALIDTNSVQGKTAVNVLKEEFSTDCAIYINADVTQRSNFEAIALRAGGIIGPYCLRDVANQNATVESAICPYAFEKTIETFNQLDIVVNNAGIIQELQWEKCIAVNFQGCITGSLLAIDKYFPRTLGNSEGIIMNVSSVAGLAPVPPMPVYAGTKHGIVGFSRSIASPLRCRGLKIKTLVVCPGKTMTSILQPIGEQIHEDFIDNLKDLLGAAAFQTPEQLASHIVAAMKNGTTGSVWKICDNKSEEIKFPTL